MTTGTHVRIGDVDTYVEDHGAGDPLVLLRGGCSRSTLSFGDLLPVLARGRRVIPVEMQGHGRTPDLDREPTLRVEHAVEVRDAIPDAVLAMVPRATHNALMHRVAVVAPMLEDFLAR